MEALGLEPDPAMIDAGSAARPPDTPPAADVPRVVPADYSAHGLWNAIAERTQLRIDSENLAYRLEVREREAVRLAHPRACAVKPCAPTTVLAHGGARPP